MKRIITLILTCAFAGVLAGCAGHFDYHDQATLDPPDDKNPAPTVSQHQGTAPAEWPQAKSPL